MLSNLVFLLPVIFVVLGGMVALAAEPFLRDENKHKVLPWVLQSSFAVSSAFRASSGLLAVNSSRAVKLMAS